MIFRWLFRKEMIKQEEKILSLNKQIRQLEIEREKIKVSRDYHKNRYERIEYLVNEKKKVIQDLF